MPRLEARPVCPTVWETRPHIPQGDYYLMRGAYTGRPTYLYPRMMEEKKYAVTSSLGQSLTEEDLPDWANILTGGLYGRGQAAIEASERQVQQAQTMMKVTLGLTLVTAGLVAWMVFGKGYGR